MRKVVLGTETNYSFSLGELVYLLFKKKVCHKCGSDLEKHKGSAVRTETRSPLFKQGVQVKDYKYYFVCTEYESHFSLSELASK